MQSPSPFARLRRAFTLLEIMIAITIFAMVLVGIYSCWLSILRGTKVAMDAAAEVQRARMSVRTLEDALNCTVIYGGSIQHYYFTAQTKGVDYATISFVARLAEDFPGSSLYGPENRLRHVEFSVEPGEDGNKRFVLRQWPLLTPTNLIPPYSIVLGGDVDKFQIEFWDVQKKDWVDEWLQTNQIPALVRFQLAMGFKKDVHVTEKDAVTRIVAIPAQVVPREWQIAPPVAPRPGLGGQPNQPAQPNRLQQF